MSILKDLYIGRLSTEYRMGPIRVAILRRLLMEASDILELHTPNHPILDKIDEVLEDTNEKYKP